MSVLPLLYLDENRYEKTLYYSKNRAWGTEIIKINDSHNHDPGEVQWTTKQFIEHPLISWNFILSYCINAADLLRSFHHSWNREIGRVGSFARVAIPRFTGTSKPHAFCVRGNLNIKTSESFELDSRHLSSTRMSTVASTVCTTRGCRKLIDDFKNPIMGGTWADSGDDTGHRRLITMGNQIQQPAEQVIIIIHFAGVRVQICDGTRHADARVGGISAWTLLRIDTSGC